MAVVRLVAVLAVALAIPPPDVGSIDDLPPYETLYFEERVDHFNRDAGTFKVKVLLQTTSWNETSPLLVYTGNEAPIEVFYQSTGFIRETLQQQFNAKVAYIEHRYYGTSFPGGKPFEYLSTDQVLWDYADIIQQLKPTPQSKVIVFGGSYGGMVAAVFRMKYPQIVDGAIASSGPLLMQYDTVGESYAKIASKSVRLVSETCADHLQETYKVLARLEKDPSTYSRVKSVFNACHDVTDETDFHRIAKWMTDGLQFMIQYNYPYPIDGFGAKLPANPVYVFCDYFEDYNKNKQDTPDQWKLLEAARLATGVYYNATHAETCFNVTNYPLVISGSWPYQKCTEWLMPLGQNGVDDIFGDYPWSKEAWLAECEAVYGTENKLQWENINYGLYPDIAEQLRYASNIVFSNGLIDPWSGGGIYAPDNDRITIVTMKNSSHHADLRAPNPNDPADLVAARQLEIDMISKWIQEEPATSDA